MTLISGTRQHPHIVTVPLRADEISTGLDSSTTYQIMRCIRNICTLRDVRARAPPPPPPLSCR